MTETGLICLFVLLPIDKFIDKQALPLGLQAGRVVSSHQPTSMPQAVNCGIEAFRKLKQVDSKSFVGFVADYIYMVAVGTLSISSRTIQLSASSKWIPIKIKLQ